MSFVSSNVSMLCGWYSAAREGRVATESKVV
jgi:hypothetical protein